MAKLEGLNKILMDIEKVSDAYYELENSLLYLDDDEASTSEVYLGWEGEGVKHEKLRSLRRYILKILKAEIWNQGMEGSKIEKR
jgi:hypothetical protein